MLEEQIAAIQCPPLYLQIYAGEIFVLPRGFHLPEAKLIIARYAITRVDSWMKTTSSDKGMLECRNQREKSRELWR